MNFVLAGLLGGIGGLTRVRPKKIKEEKIFSKNGEPISL